MRSSNIITAASVGKATYSSYLRTEIRDGRGDVQDSAHASRASAEVIEEAMRELDLDVGSRSSGFSPGAHS